MNPLLGFVPLLLAAPLFAQDTRITPPAAITAIRQQDLRRDLFTLAGDSMRGREAGTLDEMRASTWLADQMRQIGLMPRGDDSSYFQWWNMRRTRVSPNSTTVTVGGRTYPVWHDAILATIATTSVSAPTVFVADLRDTTRDLAGKVAVAEVAAPPAAAVRTTTNTYQYNYARTAIALDVRDRLDRRQCGGAAGD